MDTNSSLEELNNNLKDYLTTRLELLTLKTADKVSLIGSMSSVALLLTLFLFLFLFFGSMAAGFYLSELLGSNSLGFIVLSGIFLLIFIVLFLTRKKMIIKPLRNLIIRAMLDDK